MRDWDADVALQELADKHGPLISDADINDPTQIAEAVANVFRVNACLSAQAIVHIAAHEANPRVRFDAAKFVIEQATKVEGAESDPLTQLVREMSEVVANANASGG